MKHLVKNHELELVVLTRGYSIQVNGQEVQFIPETVREAELHANYALDTVVRMIQLGWRLTNAK